MQGGKGAYRDIFHRLFLGPRAVMLNLRFEPAPQPLVNPMIPQPVSPAESAVCRALLCEFGHSITLPEAKILCRYLQPILELLTDRPSVIRRRSPAKGTPSPIRVLKS